MLGCIVPETLTTDTASMTSHVFIVNDCAANAPCTIMTPTTKPPFGDLLLSSTMSTPTISVVAIDENPDRLQVAARLLRQAGGQGAPVTLNDSPLQKDMSDPQHQRWLGEFPQLAFCQLGFMTNDSIVIVVTNGTFAGPNTDLLLPNTCCSARGVYHLVCQ